MRCQTAHRFAVAWLLALASGCGGAKPAADAAGSALPPSQMVKSEPPCEQPAAQERCHDGECFVPAGCFVMGVPRDEPFASAQSDRQVTVTLTRGFWMQQTEVTLAQWRAAGLPTPNPDWRITGSKQVDVPPQGYGFCESEQCPVTWITFEDAASYANLRSEAIGKEACYELSDCEREAGRHLRCHSVRVRAASPYACEGYRLPTEAEWEYAARAGTKTAFYAGELSANRDASHNCEHDAVLDEIGWYCGNSTVGPDKLKQAHEVAQKKPNALGLFDMSGNAFEWTNDLYDPRGYGDQPLTDPLGCLTDQTNLTPAKHPAMGDYAGGDGFPAYRVNRGGSYDLWSFVAVSGRRHELGSLGGQFNGFRLVRSSP